MTKRSANRRNSVKRETAQHDITLGSAAANGAKKAQAGGRADALRESSRTASNGSTATNQISTNEAKFWLWILGSVLTALTLWSYWPTLVWMEDQWRNEPDYSHGYLIVPLALLLLYRRRDLMPRWRPQIAWSGALVLIAVLGLRVASRMAYMDFLDGWTIVLWVAGCVILFGGWSIFKWALPALLFLFLLVPLPYQAESLLSWRLQGVATSLSVAALQTLGLPALAEGHTIWIDDRQMLVEEACSGLRIFVGMAAMAYLFAVLARRAWCDKLVIVLAAVPIAILVNVFRVSATVMAFRWLPSAQAHVIHDGLGIAMIVMGAGLLAAVKIYWENLYRPFEIKVELGRLAAAS